MWFLHRKISFCLLPVSGDRITQLCICYFFLPVLLENVESSGVLTIFMPFPIIFQNVFKSLGKITSKNISALFFHLNDEEKYVHCFDILFINAIYRITLQKLSCFTIIVSTLPGPKHSSFMGMFFCQIEFWLIIFACHFKEIILTYCFTSCSQGGFI